MKQERYIKYDTYYKVDICYDTLLKCWVSIEGNSQPTKSMLKDYIKGKKQYKTN